MLLTCFVITQYYVVDKPGQSSMSCSQNLSSTLATANGEFVVLSYKSGGIGVRPEISDRLNSEFDAQERSAIRIERSCATPTLQL